MDIRKIKKLIELLEESGIAEIEIKEGEEAVRISRMGAHAPVPQYYAPAPQMAAAPAALPAAAAAAAAAPAAIPSIIEDSIRRSNHRADVPTAPARPRGPIVACVSSGVAGRPPDGGPDE
jgi:acetyl-CoA carboxylase biotin carboxyl carrier protein